MKTSMVNIGAVPRLGAKTWVKALVVAMVATVVLVGVLSALLTWTPLPESTAGFGVMLCVILANIIGGMAISKKMRANGMMAGAGLGLIYAVVIYLIGAIFLNKVDMNWHTLIMLITSVISSAFGGIIGVNTRI